MYAKCLKHELKATSRILVPLLACVLALGIFLGALFAGMGFIASFAEDEPAIEEGAGDLGDITGDEEEIDEETTVGEIVGMIVGIGIVLLVIGFFILMIVSSVSVFVLMVRRFYTSFFTDEGYLTFTLPVTVDCHLITKTLSMIIWSAISGVVIALATGSFFLGVYLMVPEAFVLDEYTKLAIEAMIESIKQSLSGTIIFSAISSIVSAIASYFLLFFSISVGCMLTKKHRFLACAGSYMVINGFVTNVVSMASYAMQYVFADMAANEATADLYGMTIALIMTIMYLVQGAGCYIGTRWILKNRINLD